MTQTSSLYFPMQGETSRGLFSDRAISPAEHLVFDLLLPEVVYLFPPVAN